MADAASTHPDGTFSLLRGGITQVNIAKNQPIAFRGALVARITATAAEAGHHEFKLVCVDPDGHAVGPELTGGFTLPAKGGHGNLAVNVEMIFPRLGHYEFLFSIDKHQRDSWPLEAREVPPTQVR